MEERHFHLDASKPDGFYPSCKECRRGLYGHEPLREREERNCAYCLIVFKPRNQQTDSNITGLFFCCAEHMRTYRRDHSSNYYVGYRKYILDRDRERCVLCDRNNPLHVHHIVPRGAGGKNEYRNLITLCGGPDGCHSVKAHGTDQARYQKEFMAYTARFDRPDFWDAVMEQSRRDDEAIKQKRSKIAKSRYRKIKDQDWYKNRAAEQRKKRNAAYRKAYKANYTTYIARFQKENDGLTPSQVRYRKQKEWREKNF